ncbi:MAG: Ig-like domain-containing protein [Rudaea sp.]|nr:Ig-like domain-containing protein [Rudaea sp.]
MSNLRLFGLVLLAIFGVQQMARAQAPVNDNWAKRTVIPALPFTTTEPNMYLATVEATDLDPPCRPVGADNESNTLWYSYTTGASTEYLTLTAGNQIIGMITVYTGSPGAFTLVSGGCDGYSEAVGNTRIAGLRLAPNTTYSIKVGATFPVNNSNTLTFNVAAATQYVVTKTADTNDGTCDSDCSLREAIGASNANPGAVIIPAGTYELTITGADENHNATGDLDAEYGMGIYGAGMTQTIIDANHIDRVLHLDSLGYGSASFSIGDFTVQNGNAVVEGPYGDEFYGGGLLVDGYSDYIGIERVAALSNSAYWSGGGMYIAVPGTMRDSLISNNSVNQYYGGGLEYAEDTSRYLAISGSTFSGNFANTGSNGIGGGIYAQGVLYLTNSTISGNHAGYQAGGIMSQGNGSLTMTSSTVVFNTAGSNPNATRIGGGVNINGNSSNPTNIITDSIIAYNTVANPGDPPDCAIGYSSPPFSSSYNLVQYPNNCGFTGTGDVTGVDPLVSTALAYNGGPTPTHALLTGSPALDAANPAGCGDAFGNVLAYDQRGAGFPRIVGAACDKGALESPTVTPPGVPVMNPASDSGISNTDDITNVQTPGFTGNCVTGTTIQLQVDAVNVAPTTSCGAGAYAITVSSPIAQGLHAITATANNGTVTSLQSAPLAVTIDTTAPNPAIVIYPPNPDTNPSPSFSFTSNETGSTFMCSLDSAIPTACTSPATVSVGLGAHTFNVLATDVAGNFNPVPASYSWTVLPPTPAAPALASGSDSGLSDSDGITNVAVPVFTGSCTNGDSMQLVASTVSIGSPATCSGGVYSIGVSLNEGSYSISVTASSSGYTSAPSATLAVVIDRTAPLAPTITGPSGTAGATTPITGMAAETTGLITVSEGATIVCTMLGPFASGNWSCTPGFTSHGTHAVTATQTDIAGNVSVPSATFDVSVDVIFRNGFE